MSTQEDVAFRDLSGLVTYLKAALGALVLASLFTATSTWLQIALLKQAQNGGEITEAAAATNDLRQSVSGISYFVVYLTTAILFLRWTYLTKKNASCLGAEDMDFSPSWSVGSYFIPIFSFWKPYQALKETFRASHPQFKDNWRAAPHPSLLPVWWTLWIISSVIGQIMLRTSPKAETIPGLLSASWIELLSTLVDLPLIAVVLVLVSTLQGWQTAKYKSVEYSGA